MDCGPLSCHIVYHDLFIKNFTYINGPNTFLESVYFDGGETIQLDKGQRILEKRGQGRFWRNSEITVFTSL